MMYNMCQPSPGTRCPTHAGQKVIETQQALNEAYENMKNSQLSPSEKSIMRTTISKLKKKNEDAIFEYRVALAASTSESSKQTLKKHLAGTSSFPSRDEQFLTQVANSRKNAAKHIATLSQDMYESNIEKEINEYKETPAEDLSRLLQENNAKYQEIVQQLQKKINSTGADDPMLVSKAAQTKAKSLMCTNEILLRSATDNQQAKGDQSSETDDCND